MLLRQAGVTFRISPADLNEAGLMADLQAKAASAETIALALAEQKALAVSRRMPGALVLGGDSVLVFRCRTRSANAGGHGPGHGPPPGNCAPSCCCGWRAKNMH